MTFQTQPKTKRLVEFFLDAEYGDEFTYEEILEATGADVSSTGADYQRMFTVNRILEKEHLRSIATVRGIGKKVRHPREHVDGANQRRQRAAQQTALALRTMDGTNLPMLSTGESVEWANMRAHLSRIDQAVSHHDQRLARIERQLGIEPDRPPVDGTADEVTE